MSTIPISYRKCSLKLNARLSDEQNCTLLHILYRVFLNILGRIGLLVPESYLVYFLNNFTFAFFGSHIFATWKNLRFKGVAYLQTNSRGIKLLSSLPLRESCCDFIWIQTIVEFKREHYIQRQINVFLFARNSSGYIFKSRREKETFIIARYLRSNSNRF